MVGENLRRTLNRLSPLRLVRAVAEVRWDIAKISDRLQNAAELANIHPLVRAMAGEGRYAHPLSLMRYQAQVYSQHGEDGILAEMFRRIGMPQRYFVEIGVENGQQNNTRFLLEQGWQGVWIDGAEARLNEARQTFESFVRSGALKIVHSLVTADNINALLDRAEVPDEIPFLSLDIDQNTPHIWRALQRRTRVACVEYNASLPPSAAIEVPYDPECVWDGTNWFGASIKAFELIGRQKGLALVACDFSGANAFFVAADQAAGKFQEPFNAETHYEFPKYALFGPTGHPPAQRARRWVSLMDAVSEQ